MEKTYITKTYKCPKCGFYCGVPEGKEVIICPKCATELEDQNEICEIKIDYEKKTIKGFPKDFEVKLMNEKKEQGISEEFVGNPGYYCYSYYCDPNWFPPGCGWWWCINGTYGSSQICPACHGKIVWPSGGCPCGA